MYSCNANARKCNEKINRDSIIIKEIIIIIIFIINVYFTINNWDSIIIIKNIINNYLFLYKLFLELVNMMHSHYENRPIQIYWKCYHKKWKISYKNSDIF